MPEDAENSSAADARIWFEQSLQSSGWIAASHEFSDRWTELNIDWKYEWLVI